MTTIRKFGWGIAAAIVALILAVVWKLGPALAPPTHIEVGIEVGEIAPMEIALNDANGNETSLANVAGENGTVLIMTRSVDWCPFCMAQLIETNEITDAVKERGYSLVGLSYDPPASLARFAGDENIGYVLLSDEDSEFIDATGLRDPQYADDPEVDGVPYAGVLVIGSDGTVQSKMVSDDYRQRPSNEYVLGMIDDQLN